MTDYHFNCFCSEVAGTATYESKYILSIFLVNYIDFTVHQKPFFFWSDEK